MAADRTPPRLVFVEGKDTAPTGLDRQRAGLWAGGYWCLVAATFALIVYLGFVA